MSDWKVSFNLLGFLAVFVLVGMLEALSSGVPIWLGLGVGIASGIIVLYLGLIPIIGAPLGIFVNWYFLHHNGTIYFGWLFWVGLVVGVIEGLLMFFVIAKVMLG